MRYKNVVLAVNWIISKGDKIFLQRRGQPPFKNYWEVGGGTVEYGESIEEALVREAREETGLSVTPTNIIGVYSKMDRDPRGFVVAVCFAVKVIDGRLQTNREATEFKWFRLNEISDVELAFDHKKMIKDYLRWKKNKGTYWSSKGP